MKTTFILRPHWLLWFGVLTILLFGCEGPEGPAGPAGSQGIQGLPGQQGPSGAQGEPGAPGTANVIYSEWVPFNITNWSAVTEFGRATQLYEVPETLITQEIIDHGFVIIYVRFGGSTNPRPLPFTGYITSTTREQIIWYRLDVGRMIMAFHNISDNTDPSTFGSGNQYRYIIVPGGIPVAESGKSMADLRKLSYEALCEHYNIPLD